MDLCQTASPWNLNIYFSSPSLSLSQISIFRLLPPIPRIAKIPVDGSLRDLGDHRQAPLELRHHDAHGDVFDKSFGKTGSAQLRLGIALINHQVEQFVYIEVRESQFSFISLSQPKIC